MVNVCLLAEGFADPREADSADVVLVGVEAHKIVVIVGGAPEFLESNDLGRDFF